MLELARVIRPGDGVLWGQACAEPQTLVGAFLEQRATYPGASAFFGASYSGLVRPEHADCLSLASYCGIGTNRVLADAGVLEIHPVPYSQLGSLIRSGAIRCDVLMLQLSPPNRRGEYSMGLAADYLVPALERARAVVAEVNAQVPWTHSERLLRREELALVVETDRPPAAPAGSRRRELEAAIGEHASRFIPDRATLEFGIGALPEAVCTALHGRSDLRVHTGTAGDGAGELLRSGAAERIDCAMLIGSPELFALARDNARIRLRSSDYTHDPRVLAGIERFVAVNSAVEVDLSGQVNGEVAGGSYVGAVGGALDFIRAANQSPGGVSLIVLPASRIVERLSGPVGTPRSEAGVFVTERGAADLRGCSLNERVRRMKAISESP